VRGRPGGRRGRDTLAGRRTGTGGGASVERERQGQACGIFLLSHVSSVGYPKADGNCSYFFRRLSKADENYNFVRRPSLADGSCCSFVGF
jgi:hypothetical protein